MFNLILVTDGWGAFVKFPSDECNWALAMVSQIGSANVLVPSGNKPLPEPILTKSYVAIWCH